MKNIFYVVAVAAAFAILSCKKDKKTGTEETAFAGGIELTSPAEGDTVSGSFPVTGTITGNLEMHGYHIGIYRTDTEELIYESQFHEHGSSYTISETVAHTLTAITNLKVIVDVVIDHEENHVTKTVNFVYKP